MADKFDIEHVARLARIDLAEQEKKVLEKDFKEIISYFDKVGSFRIPDFEESGISRGVSLREDSVKKSLESEKVVQEGIKMEGGFFKGPKIL